MNKKLLLILTLSVIINCVSANTATIVHAKTGELKKEINFVLESSQYRNITINTIVITSGVEEPMPFMDFDDCRAIAELPFEIQTVNLQSAFFEGEKIPSPPQPLKGAFSSGNFEKIIFPNTIREIGDYAFFKCYSLIQISFPNVENIGKEAFSTCASLSDILLPKLQCIDFGAFSHCHSLKNISLPNVGALPPDAFYNCTNLTTVSLPKASEIGEGAFKHCPKLTALELGGNSAIVGIGAFFKVNPHVLILLKNISELSGFSFQFPSESTIVYKENLANSTITQEGNSIEFINNIPHIGNIMWYKNGKQMAGEYRNFLYISRVKPDDEGEYSMSFYYNNTKIFLFPITLKIDREAIGN